MNTDIKKAQEIEKEIFGNCHSDRDYQERLINSGKIYFKYAEDNDKPISFLVSYIRDGNIYIWLCGTLPSACRKGAFKALIAQMLSDYPNTTVSVRTFPNTYKVMHAWIQKTGFSNGMHIRDDPDKGPFYHYEIDKYRIT